MRGLFIVSSISYFLITPYPSKFEPFRGWYSLRFLYTHFPKKESVNHNKILFRAVSILKHIKNDQIAFKAQDWACGYAPHQFQLKFHQTKLSLP